MVTYHDNNIITNKKNSKKDLNALIKRTHNTDSGVRGWN
jgi:hypothetical protein